MWGATAPVMQIGPELRSKQDWWLANAADQIFCAIKRATTERDYFPGEPLGVVYRALMAELALRNHRPRRLTGPPFKRQADACDVYEPSGLESACANCGLTRGAHTRQAIERGGERG